LLKGIHVLKKTSDIAVTEAGDRPERSGTVEALKNERDLLQAVMNGARNTHLVFLDRDFNFVRVNETYAATCGYSPEALIGKNHFALYPNAENEAIFTRVRDTGEPFEAHDKPFEFPDHPERGVTYWNWTLIPVKHPDGRIDGLVFSLHETTARKRAELALQESEERARRQAEEMQLIFDSAHIGLCVIDLDLRYVRVNRQLAALNGVPAEYHIGKTVAEIVPSLEPMAKEIVERIKRTGEGRLDMEFTGYTAASPGTPRTWLEQWVPLRDAAGRVVGVNVAVEEITGRKLAELALRESEAKYRTLFRNMAEGFALYELVRDAGGAPVDWRVLEVNDAYTRHTGVEAGKVVGRLASELFPDVLHDYLPKFVKIVQDRQSYTFDTYAKAVGRDLHVVNFPVGGDRFAGVIEDISERRQAEANLVKLAGALQAVNTALRQREEQLRIFVEHAPAAIAMMDREMRYLAASSRWLADYGLTGRVVIGRSYYEILPEVPERWKAIHRRCLAGAVERAEEDPFDRADGSRTWLRWEIHPWKVGPGEIGGIVIFSEDITARKLAEQALREGEERARFQAEALARSNRDLEQFAYVASHDLQEPLRMVMAFAGLLREGYRDQLDEKAGDYLGFMIDGAGRMQTLINDLLAYSRLSGRAGQREPIRVDDVLDSALVNLKAAIDESGARISREPLPTLIADSTQLVQLFQNLIGNAIKYRAPGVTPDIRIGVESISKTGGPAWRFSVRDNGIGIESQYIGRIFEIFQRLHTREEYEGTGIGLAICKKIVECHGGRIWVQSKVGEGSTFFFTLPA
jgi:PAS domain S-box-containing protein